MLLKQLLDDLRAFSGIRSKRQIKTIAKSLSNACVAEYPNGDDTSAIKRADGFDLMATEGFLPDFVNTDPWFAGWCGVMVNVSDIAAMGGRPVGVVNTIWGKDDEATQQIFAGMAAASQVFGVPILGGHTNLNASSLHLSVAILGRAKNLLSSFAAKPGHAIVAAIDMRGAYRKPFLNWNAATDAPAQRLREDLALLPKIAEGQMAYAAKDISQAGILGTCLMLLESSGVGAKIQLDSIPKPQQIAWSDWLRSFPSYGYLLTTPSEKVAPLLELFEQRDIAAAHIGNITPGATLAVDYQNQSEIFWNLQQQPLTGMSGAPANFQNKLAGAMNHA